MWLWIINATVWIWIYTDFSCLYVQWKLLLGYFNTMTLDHTQYTSQFLPLTTNYTNFSKASTVKHAELQLLAFFFFCILKANLCICDKSTLQHSQTLTSPVINTWALNYKCAQLFLHRCVYIIHPEVMVFSVFYTYTG